MKEVFDKIFYHPDTLYLVGFSGGKDSIATVLSLLEMGVLKSQIELHHHDVDGSSEKLWDWQCTESYCKAFAKAFDLPIYFSYRYGGIEREIKRKNEGLQDVYFQQHSCGSFHRLASLPGNDTRMKFPAISADLRTRWCSSCVKIDVMSRVITNTERYKGKNLIVCTGERREESSARAKYEVIEWHRTNTKSRLVLHWRPVIELLESDVWALFKKYKVQPHPCYCLGWSRCSCMTCIFGDPDVWASIEHLAPWKLDYIYKLEKELNFTLHDKENIYQFAAKGKSFLLYENLQRWGAEALNTFVSPIIVENWTLPQGAYKHQKAGSL
jgi:3'-phosphoadenosine 5'-phosphosulfate sulfotransferase (PAPS reductase)/FAD synthetase